MNWVIWIFNCLWGYFGISKYGFIELEYNVIILLFWEEEKTWLSKVCLGVGLSQAGSMHPGFLLRSPSESMPRLTCLSCGANHNEKKRQWSASVFHYYEINTQVQLILFIFKKIKAQSDKILKNLQSSLTLQIKIQKLYDWLNLLRKPCDCMSASSLERANNSQPSLSAPLFLKANSQPSPCLV